MGPPCVAWATFPVRRNRADRCCRWSRRVEPRAGARWRGVVSGDAVVLALMRRPLAARRADVRARELALQSLVAAEAANLLPVLQGLRDAPALREPALQGRGAYDAPATPSIILD